MADLLDRQAPMGAPSVPTSADPEAILKYIHDLNAWIKPMFLSGTQATFYNQEQLDEFVAQNDKAQVGKHFFNSTTGLPAVGVLVAGNLAIQTITTS